MNGESDTYPTLSVPPSIASPSFSTRCSNVTGSTSSPGEAFSSVFSEVPEPLLESSALSSVSPLPQAAKINATAAVLASMLYLFLFDILTLPFSYPNLCFASAARCSARPT